jgi:metallo-beta-lactamase class B
MPQMIRTLITIVLLLATTSPARAQANDWMQPFPAFRIAGNLYYVGSKGLAAYLITTPQGHILINSNLEDSVPMIRASIEKLGFKYSDVRILLINHAHFDHDAGSAPIKQQTGAAYMVMEGDVPVVESGGTRDFQYGNDKGTLYKPVKVDRMLKDGDQVKLGDTVLVARLTAGHTKGCTTWTMTVKDGAKSYQAVIVGSPNVNPGYKLVNNAAYPGIAEDYARGFKTLAALPADLFLGAHGSYFGMDEKYARLQKGDAEAFVDREGYKKFVAAKTAEFERELRKQQAAGK